MRLLIILLFLLHPIVAVALQSQDDDLIIGAFDSNQNKQLIFNSQNGNGGIIRFNEAEGLLQFRHENGTFATLGTGSGGGGGGGISQSVLDTAIASERADWMAADTALGVRIDNVPSLPSGGTDGQLLYRTGSGYEWDEGPFEYAETLPSYGSPIDFDRQQLLFLRDVDDDPYLDSIGLIQGTSQVFRMKDNAPYTEGSFTDYVAGLSVGDRFTVSVTNGSLACGIPDVSGSGSNLWLGAGDPSNTAVSSSTFLEQMAWVYIARQLSPSQDVVTDPRGLATGQTLNDVLDNFCDNSRPTNQSLAIVLRVLSTSTTGPFPQLSLRFGYSGSSSFSTRTTATTISSALPSARIEAVYVGHRDSDSSMEFESFRGSYPSNISRNVIGAKGVYARLGGIWTRLDNVASGSSFTSADETKLDGIEAGATADQTAAEIVSALEALSGEARLDAGAIKNLPTGGGGGSGLTSVLSDATLTGSGTSSSLLSVANPFTAADESKLDGIETGATADQTPTQIRNALAGLTGNSRLSADAIKDIQEAGIIVLPSGVTALTFFAEIPESERSNYVGKFLLNNTLGSIRRIRYLSGNSGPIGFPTYGAGYVAMYGGELPNDESLYPITIPPYSIVQDRRGGSTRYYFHEHNSDWSVNFADVPNANFIRIDGGANSLSQVSTDRTLRGDGTPEDPLGVTAKPYFVVVVDDDARSLMFQSDIEDGGIVVVADTGAQFRVNYSGTDLVFTPDLNTKLAVASSTAQRVEQGWLVQSGSSIYLCIATTEGVTTTSIVGNSNFIDLTQVTSSEFSTLTDRTASIESKIAVLARIAPYDDVLIDLLRNIHSDVHETRNIFDDGYSDAIDYSLNSDATGSGKLTSGLSYDSSSGEFRGIGSSKQRVMAWEIRSNNANNTIFGVKNAGGQDVAIMRLNNGILQVNTAGGRNNASYRNVNDLNDTAISFSAGDRLIVQTIPLANGNIRIVPVFYDASADTHSHLRFDELNDVEFANLSNINWQTVEIRGATRFKSVINSENLTHDDLEELLENHWGDEYVFGKYREEDVVANKIVVDKEVDFLGGLKVNGVDVTGGGSSGLPSSITELAGTVQADNTTEFSLPSNWQDYAAVSVTYDSDDSERFAHTLFVKRIKEKLEDTSSDSVSFYVSGYGTGVISIDISDTDNPKVIFAATADGSAIPNARVYLEPQAMGPKGDKGERGEDGSDGAAGPTGPQGPAGAQGPRGLQGQQGVAGPTGPQGPRGPTGPAGAAGADGEGVPTGGTTGQVLAKASGTDRDTEWVDAASGGDKPYYVVVTSTTARDNLTQADIQDKGFVELRSSRGADTDIYYRGTFYIATYSGSSLTLDEQDRSRFRNFSSASAMTNISFRHGTLIKTDDNNRVYMVKEDLVNITSTFTLARQIELGNIVELGAGGEAELPTGGATGQVLGKASAADGDVEWVNLPVGGGNINTDASISGDGSAGNPLSAEITGLSATWTSGANFDDLSNSVRFISYVTNDTPRNAPFTGTPGTVSILRWRVTTSKSAPNMTQTALNLRTIEFYERTRTNSVWGDWVHYGTGFGHLPDGGTTGQILAKASDADNDTEWVDAASGGGTVSTDASISGDGSSGSPLSAEIVGLQEEWTSSNDFNNLSNSVRMIGYAPTTSLPSNAPVTTSSINAVALQVVTSKTSTSMTQSALDLLTGKLYYRIRLSSSSNWTAWSEATDTSGSSRRLTEKGFTVGSHVGVSGQAQTSQRLITLPSGKTLSDYDRIALRITWPTSGTSINNTSISSFHIPELINISTNDWDAVSTPATSRGASLFHIEINPSTILGTSTSFNIRLRDTNTQAPQQMNTATIEEVIGVGG